MLAAGVPFRGALDAYATSMVHLYDPARRWLTAYTGNLVRLRRASDNAESNFTYTATGELDLAAIATWAGGASYVVTVYDQKGADNVTQATAANQPLFTASAQNGHAGMTFDGTNDFLQGAFTNGGALSQPYSVFALAKLDATQVNDDVYRLLVDGDDSSNRMIIGQDAADTPDAWRIYAGSALSSGTSNSNVLIWSVVFNGVSSQFWNNAVSQASGDAGAQNADGLTVGSRYLNAQEPWKGIIGTLAIADPAFNDTDRQAVQVILNTYWAVY